MNVFIVFVHYLQQIFQRTIISHIYVHVHVHPGQLGPTDTRAKKELQIYIFHIMKNVLEYSMLPEIYVYMMM